MNAIQLIQSDHAAVEQLFRRFERSRGAGGELRRIVRALVKELSIHAAIEEQLLYPALRRRRDGSPPEVLEALEEHHLVKLTLRELEGMRPSDARYRAKVAVLAENVRQHVREEERNLLPQLRRRMDPEELRALGNAMALLKKTAPTRPHPASPDEPPANLLAGVAASAYDRGREAVARGFERALARGRDVVDAALRRGERSADRARRQLSRGLERAAGEVAPETR